MMRSIGFFSKRPWGGGKKITDLSFGSISVGSCDFENFLPLYL
jgi:hypothetical protein